jgi:prephenate dehydratase
VSRPIPSRPFDYRFDCVLGGHPLDHDVATALAEMQRETARLRVFGSYRADLEDEGAATVAA